MMTKKEKITEAITREVGRILDHYGWFGIVKGQYDSLKADLSHAQHTPFYFWAEGQDIDPVKDPHYQTLYNVVKMQNKKIGDLEKDLEKFRDKVDTLEKRSLLEFEELTKLKERPIELETKVEHLTMRDRVLDTRERELRERLVRVESACEITLADPEPSKASYERWLKELLQSITFKFEETERSDESKNMIDEEK